MAFMYDYLTESELEIEKELRRNEVESLRLINAMEAVVMRHELDLSQIEAKAVFENYTEDILASEYEREYNIYTEGVKEAWEKFKQWFKGIINAILGRNKQNNSAELLQSSEEVELDHDPNAFINLINSVTDAIKKFFTFKKVNADGESEVDKVKVIISGVGAVTGVTAVGAAVKNFIEDGKKTKVKVNHLQQFSDKITSALNRLKGVIWGGSSDKADGSVKSEVMTMSSNLANFGESFVEKIGTIIDKFKKGGKSAPEPGENTPENGDGNGSNGGANEEPPASQEGTPEKNPGSKEPASEGGNNGANPSNGNGNKKMYSYGGAQVPSAIVSYAFSHGKVGINDANKNRNKKKISLSSTEMAAVYNAAKQNGDLNEKDLEKWKEFINNNGDKAITVEFTDDGYITMGDPIFENMGLGDIDRILGDDYDIDEMFESTDMGLLDDINGIFDEFFS